MRASVRIPSFALAFTSAVALAAACGPGNANGPGPVTAPTGGDLDASAGTPPVSTGTTPSPTASTDTPAPANAKLCGCSLCEPVFSDDTCAADADCAPATQCHADKCVAKANATPPAKNMMCTEIMKCGSTDANQCACLSGRCALAPRKSK